jgi:uncharacterized protein
VRVRPFHQFVVKLHSRCNLACDYCYVYEMADQRWRSRPRVMSPADVEHTAARIAEHAAAHGLAEVEVVLHGGEPLLAGPAAVEHVVTAVRSRVPARFSVQTNGTLLDRRFLEVLRALDVRVGVSLDGDARATARHRGDSHTAVRAGLDLLGSPEFRPLFAGLLCVVDLRNDPVRTYEALLACGPPTVDFLLPHGNWSTPPPGLGYADWLIAVFDRWYGAPTRETGVRLFEEIAHVLLGGRSRVEGIGVSPALQVVVETDGMIEQSDILASAFEGAAVTGLHVARDSFDAALRLPDVRARQAGVAGLPAVCRACDLHVVCGGGLRAHRYREGAGFDRPSVYCADLYRLIRHVRGRLARDLERVS